MAGRGIRVPFFADVADMLRGTRKISDELDDLADGLRDAERAADDLDLSGVGRDADRAFDRAERAAEGFARDADRAFDRVERSADDAFDGIRDEAEQSSAETFASFDGSFESIIEGFQEVASQSSRILGGIGGTIVGLAGAAGIGLVLAAFEKWREAQEEIKAGAAELFARYQEVGSAIDANVVKEREAEYVQSLTNEQTAQVLATIDKVNAAAGETVLTFEDVVDYATGQKEQLVSSVDLIGKFRDTGRLTTGEASRLFAELGKVRDTTGRFRAESELALQKWDALRGRIEGIPRSLTVDVELKQRVTNSSSLPWYVRDALQQSAGG